MTPEALKAVYQDSNSWQQVADAVNHDTTTTTGEYKVIGCNDPADKHLVGKTLNSTDKPTTDCYAKATQSKGEWTASMVADLAHKPYGHVDIANAHNAALASEREKAKAFTEASGRALRKYQQQLAAEREKAKYWRDLFQDKDDQLAAAMEAMRKIRAAVGPSEMVDIADAALAKIGK